jgi:hypothetical protein
MFELPRSMVLAAVLALAIAGNAVAATLAPAQFQDRVVREVLKRHPDARISRPNDHQLIVDIPGRNTFSSNLERIFSLYQQTPGELDLIVANAAASLDADDVEITQEALIIIVRPEAYVPVTAAGDRAPFRPLAGGMVAVVAIETHDAYVIRPSSELRAKLKLQDAEIWRRASSNTRLHVAFAPRELPAKGIAEISSGQGLASSLLFDDAFWDSPELTRHGPVVVAAVARDNLFVALLSDGEAVGRMRKAMASVRDDPNGLTNDLIVRRNGHWETLP